MGGLGSATPLPPSAAPMGSPLTQPRLMNGASKQQAVPRVVPPPDDASTPKVGLAMKESVESDAANFPARVGLNKSCTELFNSLPPSGQFIVAFLAKQEITAAEKVNPSAVNPTVITWAKIKAFENRPQEVKADFLWQILDDNAKAAVEPFPADAKQEIFSKVDVSHRSLRMNASNVVMVLAKVKRRELESATAEAQGARDLPPPAQDPDVQPETDGSPVQKEPEARAQEQDGLQRAPKTAAPRPPLHPASALGGIEAPKAAELRPPPRPASALGGILAGKAQAKSKSARPKLALPPKVTAAVTPPPPKPPFIPAPRLAPPASAPRVVPPPSATTSNGSGQSRASEGNHAQQYDMS
eukprot:gnl/TRDRNA2_/TRDRNA2_174191_c7_seq11.p1 gnl/TRDRNA2_/TRDRNA2_174191_c7~~gnl/TRDRNA2_/TRDRNA2_174191_c7_seq11.p1  ORF type:complete len:371 (-),score=66.93 gnl/TRDRNA2_/TRDRNA2_174191_c7_seq11:15-1082(-)